MKRLFPWFAVGLLLVTSGFPFLHGPTSANLSPQINNQIILLAGDVIDLQWDPASYPLFSDESFLRWELFGQNLNPPSTRIDSGKDHTIGYYRHSGLAANGEYFYRLEVVNCLSPCTSVTDERRHTVFTDSAHTNRLEGRVIKTLSMKPMEVQVGTGEVDYNLTIQDGVTFNIGSGAKLNKGSALPKILVRNSTLNIDGAEINGIGTINFGSYDPPYWGKGKVVNTTFAAVPADQDPTYIRLYGDGEVLIQQNTGQLNIYGYGATRVRIEDNVLANPFINFSGGSKLELIGNELIQYDLPLYDHMVWLSDGVQASLLGNRLEYLPSDYGGLELLVGSGSSTSLTVRSNAFINAIVTLNEGVQVDFSDNLVDGEFGYLNLGPDNLDCPDNVQASGRIERNTIQNANGIDIIKPGALTIKQNCIRNNGFGLDFGLPCTADVLDITSNWWGHASGPYHVSQNPSGLGDKINGSQVSFKPYLTVETNCRDQAPPMPQDLRILGMEAVQVTQTLDNSVPLVAGKPTIIRIYPDALGGAISPVDWRLDISRDSTLLGSFSGQISARRVGDIERERDSETGGVRVLLPEEWQTGALQAVFTIDPNNAITELNDSNNTRKETFNFAARRPLRVLYQLIHLVIPAQGIDASPDQNKAPGLGLWLDHYFPHPNLDYHLLPNALEWNESLKNVADPQLTALEKRLKNALKDSLNVYNQNPPNGNPYDQIFGIYPGDGGQYLDYCGSEGSWLVTPAQASFCGTNSEYMAHEIAHNYGARHPGLGAESCNADDPGTDWPYATAAIQQPALDFLNAKLVPRTAKDVMSYCPVTFFSPHTYTKLYLNLPNMPAAGPEPVAALADQEYLRVSGLVFMNGSVEFDPIFHFTSASTPQNPPPGSDYCLELSDGAAVLPGQRCFDLPFTDEDSGDPIDVDSFMIHLPLAGGTAKVVLTHQGSTLGQITSSAHAPQVTLITPNGGGTAGDPLPVQWSASDLDGDTLTYRLLLSTDNGVSWIPLAMNLQDVTSISLDTSLVPGASQALIRVQVSDGFHMASDDSNAVFAITQKSPLAQITLPADGATIQPDGALAGAAYDPEDGVLSGDSLTWSSNIDGSLGSGASLSDLGLSEGQHILTLTATDSTAHASSMSITVNVVKLRPVYLPLVNRH